MLNQLKKVVAVGFALLASVFVSPSQAAPITYNVTLTVTSPPGYSEDGPPLANPPTIGSVYKIRLTVDDSVLLTDGISMPGLVLGFRAKIDQTIWDMNQDSDFAGFRGPCYGRDSCTDEEWDMWGMPSDYLGFDVVDGKVVGLRGGVFGDLDFPFIDFDGNTFASLSGFAAGEDELVEVALNGTLAIELAPSAVPEPGTLLLSALGLVGVIGLVRRRTARLA